MTTLLESAAAIGGDVIVFDGNSAFVVGSLLLYRFFKEIEQDMLAEDRWEGEGGAIR